MQIHILLFLKFPVPFVRTTKKAYHTVLKILLEFFDDNKFIKATLCCVWNNWNFISCWSVRVKCAEQTTFNLLQSLQIFGSCYIV